RSLRCRRYGSMARFRSGVPVLGQGRESRLGGRHVHLVATVLATAVLACQRLVHRERMTAVLTGESYLHGGPPYSVASRGCDLSGLNDAVVASRVKSAGVESLDLVPSVLQRRGTWPMSTNGLTPQRDFRALGAGRIDRERKSRNLLKLDLIIAQAPAYN